MTSWARAAAYMPTPNALIIATMAPSMMPITSRAWFSVHSSDASALGAPGGIGTWRAPVPRMNTHSAATTRPIATTTSVAIRSRISPGSVESSQSSQPGLRLIDGGTRRTSGEGDACRIESAVTCAPEERYSRLLSLAYEIL